MFTFPFGFFGGAGDPPWSSVTLLLPGNGTNGSTVIPDVSISAKSIAVLGNAKISTAQSKFGGASILFDGAGDYLSAPYTPANDLGASSWTIEAWIYPLTIAAGSRGIVGFAVAVPTEGISLRQDGSTLQFWVNGYGGITTQTGTISANTWHHVALVRNGTSNTLYLNGVSVASNTVSPVYGSVTTLVVGRTYANLNNEYFNGYIDDLRVTKGVARYTANFTPPTSAHPIG